MQEAVTFEVHDTGVGISLEGQQSLFKLFGRAIHKNKAINKEGIGLGLYITKNLAIQLKGTIDYSTEEGSFTKFIVTLPIVTDFQEAMSRGLLKLNK